jgi:hypothetical protein
MAETTADVRRDIEMTRERMSTTLAELERKVNLMQIVRDHPWPALAVALGAGVLLSGSRADIKAAGATLAATRGASSRIGSALDDVVASLMAGVGEAVHHRVDSLVTEIKDAIGARPGREVHPGASPARGFGGETRTSGSPSAAVLGSELRAGESGEVREWQRTRAD